MFQIIAAMAEFERALIQERVRAGLRNARKNGKKLGRPRVVVDVVQICSLRASGASWRGRHALQGASAAFRKPLSGVVGKWLIPDSWVSRKTSSTNT